jgi:hypothetical protein
MLSLVTLGKIHFADSQQEAKELFLNRQKNGIGGVIFTPEFDVPKWTDTEKNRLSDFFCEVDATEEDDNRHDGVPDWAAVSQNVTRNLFKLSKEFNTTSNARSIRFLSDDDFDLKPHCDIGAMDGWVHLHVTGAGLLCASPIGDAPVKVKATGSFGDNLEKDDFDRLLKIERKIELIELEEGKAIAFDNTMAHMSNRGPRFRIPIFG